MEAGEYAVRGALIDLFPSGYEQAIRVDMFGDDVESAIAKFPNFEHLEARGRRK